MKDKKAIIRIIEATLAVLIILGVILAVAINQRQATTQERDLSRAILPILDEIAKNTTLRNAVLSNDNTTIINFVSNKINQNYFAFELKICNPAEICALDKYLETSIYAGERIISSNLTEYAPKKVKLFVWIKE